MSEPIAFALFLIRLDYLLCCFCDLESNGTRIESRFGLCYENARNLVMKMLGILKYECSFEPDSCLILLRLLLVLITFCVPFVIWDRFTYTDSRFTGSCLRYERIMVSCSTRDFLSFGVCFTWIGPLVMCQKRLACVHFLSVFGVFLKTFMLKYSQFLCQSVAFRVSYNFVITLDP